MTELWLNFKNENGLLKRVPVESERFTVGRTSDNDLSVPFPELSRRHILIERFDDAFFVSDLGSSNGTTLDDINLIEPVELKNGDSLNLGGGLEINIEIIFAKANNSAQELGSGAINAVSANEIGASAPEFSVSKTANVSSDSGGSSIPFGFFLLAPLLVLLILGVVGIFLFISSNDSNVAQGNDNLVYQPTNPPEEDPNFPEDDTPTPTPTVAANSSPVGTTSVTPSPDLPENSPTPASGDTDKVERASVSFLRRIAANDARPFLTGKQITALNSKLNQFKGSTALAENLKNARQNSAQIEELARSKNLRPQFVATAALTQLGNQRGDVAKTAQGMIETLGNLRGTFGNELASDNLLMIAIYDQAAADRIISTRDMIAGLANKFPDVNPRTIRTIWFLRDNGKLSDSQFDFAIKFLAIGIITQNPKDFNVQSEAVVFN